MPRYVQGNFSLTQQEFEELHNKLVNTMRDYFTAHGGDPRTVRWPDAALVSINMMAALIFVVPKDRRNDAIDDIISKLEELRTTYVH